LGAAETTTYEFRRIEIPTKLGVSLNYDKLVDELNELGAEGWSVVSPLAVQEGITKSLILQRERRA
jgi:hypothetical protein